MERSMMGEWYYRENETFSDVEMPWYDTYHQGVPRAPVQPTYNLLEEMEENCYQWASTRSRRQSTFLDPEESITVNAMAALQAQMDNLARQINNLAATSSSPVETTQYGCDLCGQQSHITTDCFISRNNNMEKVNFRFAQDGHGSNDFYSDTYNPWWNNHSNDSWSNDPYDDFQSQRYEEVLNSIEAKFEGVLVRASKRDEERKKEYERMEREAEEQANLMEASRRHLEIQMSKLADVLATNSVCNLPRNMEADLRQHIEASTPKCGEELEEPGKRQVEPHLVEDQVDKGMDEEDHLYTFHPPSSSKKPLSYLTDSAEEISFNYFDDVKAFEKREGEEQMTMEVDFKEYKEVSVQKVDAEVSKEQTSMEIKDEEDVHVSVQKAQDEEKMKVMKEESIQSTFMKVKLSELMDDSGSLVIPYYDDSSLQTREVLNSLGFLTLINHALLSTLQYVAYLQATTLNLITIGGRKPLIIDPG